MTRTRYEDDDRNLPPPRKSSGAAPVVIILVVLAAVLVVGAVVCGGFFMLAWRAAPEPAPNQAPEVGPADAPVIQPAGGKERDGKRMYSCDEFQELVIGKSPDEVIAAIGRPDGTQDESKTKHSTWHYRNRILNPATGKSGTGIIEIENGKVIAVRW